MNNNKSYADNNRSYGWFILVQGGTPDKVTMAG